MQIGPITPEYIIEQSKLVDEATLLIIIENYGDEQYERGAYNASFTY